MGDRYREEIKKGKGKQKAAAYGSPGAEAEARAKIRAEYFRKSRKAARAAPGYSKAPAWRRLDA